MSLSQKKKEAVHFTLLMAATALLARGLGIPSSIVTAKYLGPSTLGALAIIKLIIQYIGYCQLGIMNSLARDVPIAYGRNDKAEIESIRNVVFTGFSLASLLGLLGLWILFAFGVTFNNAMTWPILSLSSLIFIANRLNTFFRNYAKAEGIFITIGQSDFIQQLLGPTLTMVLVINLEIHGALIALFLSQLLPTYLYYRQIPSISVKFDLNLQKLWNQIKTGFLLFINKISEDLFWSVDIIIISSLLTRTDVGYYSFALSAIAFITPIAGAINNVVFRDMLIKGGQKGQKDIQHLERYVKEPLICYLLLSHLLLGLGVLSFITLVYLFLPNYLNSIPIIHILSIGYMAYLSRYFSSFFLNVTNQLPRIFLIYKIGIITNGLLDYIAIQIGYGIEGVALACTFAFFLTSNLMLTLNHHQIYRNKIKLLVFLSRLNLMPLLLSASIYFIADYFNTGLIVDLSNIKSIAHILLNFFYFNNLDAQ